MPAAALKVSARYLADRFLAAVSATRAANWVGYARTVRGAGYPFVWDPADVHTSAESGGQTPTLLNEPVTRWQANVTHRIREDLSVVARSGNLLNARRAGPGDYA